MTEFLEIITKWLNELFQFWGKDNQLYVAIAIWTAIGAIISFFLALMFRAACGWIAEEEMTFWRAFVSMFWAVIVCFLVSFGIAFLYGLLGVPKHRLGTMWYFSVPLWFLVVALTSTISTRGDFLNGVMVALATFFLLLCSGAFLVGFLWVVNQVV